MPHARSFVETSPFEASVNDSVVVNMRAFIPNILPSNPSYIQPVPNHPNQTMISGPFRGITGELPGWLRALAPESIAAATDCFLTDDRGFSSSFDVPSKVATSFAIIIRKGKVSIVPHEGSKAHLPGLSVRLNGTSGARIAEKLGTFDGAYGNRALGAPSVADGKIQIAGQCSSGNPHVVGAPMIDYSFDFIYEVTTKNLMYKINYGAFPSFEFYVSREGSKAITVLNEHPSKTTAWGLTDLGTGLFMERRNGTIDLSSPPPPENGRSIPRKQIIGEWIAEENGKLFKWTMIDYESRCELVSKLPGNPWETVTLFGKWEILGNALIIQNGSLGLFFKIQGNLLIQERSSRVYVRESKN